MPFFWCVAVSCQDESWGRWEPPKARFALAFFSFFFTPVRSGTGAAARPAGTSGGTSQPSAGAVAGRTAEGFFLGGVPSFFRARASRRRVLRRSPFFFLGFCVARGGPPPPSAGGRRSSTPPRRVFSPSFFLFFPLAWQDRARVELAVKARSSSLGRRPFFFPVRTRSSTPRRPVPPWRRHGCWSSNGRRRDPFFFWGWAGPANPFCRWT